ncbi:uncharacterized protein LOC114804789 isoform X1 [Zeugodacus cucurbitae]|uniref:uncharacterized protein LOC114804789 isoform X1 n=1 Tax=Zeugodacus cucurbitae TaxID=28588 RepID=UPI0023D8EEBB|nr:uncharacterized protein LOC114804789 isoform X1 [Zeugodacus cucurbitae]
MASLKYWHIYLLLLRLVGICPASFSRKNKKFISTARDLLVALVITALTLITTECLLLISIHFAFGHDLNMYTDFKTGNTLFFIEIIAATVLQLFQSIYIFMLRNTGIEMLNVIYKHICVYTENSSACDFRLNRCIRWTLVAHLLTLAVHEVNLLSSIWAHNLPLRLTFCLSFVLTIRPTFCFIVLSTYIYIVYVLCHILAFYNNRLLTMETHLIKSKLVLRQKLCKLLILRTELISLSCKNISQVYGVAVLLETCYILSILPSFPAFVLKMFSWNMPFNIKFLGHSVRALFWVLPPLLILIQAMAINTINAEVKILY